MHIAPKIIIGLIAIIHLVILWLEMFAWTSKAPIFFKNLPKHLFKETKVLAGNLGLYNGFIAAGLIWSLTITNIWWQKDIAIFFLACVFLAGIYGAITASKKILWIQTIPALLAYILITLLK